MHKSNAPVQSTKESCDNYLWSKIHTNILFINFRFIKCVDIIKYKTSILIYKVKYKLFTNNI